MGTTDVKCPECGAITYKLKLNGGDVKAVQGDSGHSQTSMVTDVYSHILDDDRRINAQLFEDTFYAGKGKDPDTVPAAPEFGKFKRHVQGQDSLAVGRVFESPRGRALAGTERSRFFL